MKVRFGTDGWRGIVADDFTYETLRYVAQGVAEYLLTRPAELERRIEDVMRRGPSGVRRAEPGDRLIRRHDPRPSYFEQVGRMVDLDRLRGAGLRLVHECMHGSAFGYLTGLLDGGATTVT